jgi:XTP/dITP diphosphohydrolase
MKLVFASSNKNKVLEVKDILPKHVQLISLEDINCYDDIPETATTIEGNAILKANYITKKYAISCFADDTGLEVEALNGEPGVFSARYAGNHGNDKENIKKLLLNLKSHSNRKARFKTVIALNYHNEQYLFEGIINGHITEKEIGENGFGYDSVFCPNGYHQTFAEMTSELKNTISHRKIAVKKLITFLINN